MYLTMQHSSRSGFFFSSEEAAERSALGCLFCTFLLSFVFIMLPRRAWPVRTRMRPATFLDKNLSVSDVSGTQLLFPESLFNTSIVLSSPTVSNLHFISTFGPLMFHGTSPGNPSGFHIPVISVSITPYTAQIP